MLTAALLLGLCPSPTPALPAAPAPVVLPGDGADAALLPAETRFVAHVDLRALFASRLWNELAGPQALAEMEASEEFQQLQTQLGLDPLVDVHSITVYGASPDEESAAVLVRGTKALENALRRVEGMDGHTRIEVEGLAVHVFDQGGEATYIYSHATDRDEGIVVLSPSRTELLRSALVLRGSRSSIASVASTPAAVPLELDAPAGTLMQVAFAGAIPGMDGNDPISGVLRSARGGVFRVGEERDELAMHLGLVTESDAKALEMADAVDGLKALANVLMQNMDDVPAEARQLLRSFRVNNDDSMVYVDFAFPLGDLLEMARENGLAR